MTTPTPRTNAQWGRMCLSLIEAVRENPGAEAYADATAELIDELRGLDDLQDVGLVFSQVLLLMAGYAVGFANALQDANPNIDVAEIIRQMSWDTAMEDDGSTPFDDKGDPDPDG